MNQKSVIRLTLLLIFCLTSLFKISEFYDLVSGLIVVVLLIFDLFEKNHKNNFITEFIYYFSWTIITLITFTIRGSYIRPFNPIFIILIIKLTTSALYLIRYKSIQVTRTLLSKITLTFFALYIIELLTNSTHGFASNVIFWTKISSIELILILLIKKDRIDYKVSIVNFIWK